MTRKESSEVYGLICTAATSAYGNGTLKAPEVQKILLYIYERLGQNHGDAEPSV